MATLTMIPAHVGGPDTFETKCIVFPYFQDLTVADKIWSRSCHDFPRPYKLPSESKSENHYFCKNCPHDIVLGIFLSIS